MENKNKLPQEWNIFYAKRNIVDYIWKSANLEGIAVTFPETNQIYNDINVARLGLEQIQTIVNLKHTWQFILETIDYPISYNYICMLNKTVGAANLVLNAGRVRKSPVTISGTDWKPELPIENIVKEKIEEILMIDNETDRAMTLMLYLMRAQIFYDGNKRTAMLAANQIMISNGCGIISVPIEKQNDFFKLLIEYYESNNSEKTKQFIYDFCIEEMFFDEEIENDNLEVDEQIENELNKALAKINEETKEAIKIQTLIEPHKKGLT